MVHPRSSSLSRPVAIHISGPSIRNLLLATADRVKLARGMNQGSLPICGVSSSKTDEEKYSGKPKFAVCGEHAVQDALWIDRDDSDFTPFKTPGAILPSAPSSQPVYPLPIRKYETGKNLRPVWHPLCLIIPIEWDSGSLRKHVLDVRIRFTWMKPISGSRQGNCRRSTGETIPDLFRTQLQGHNIKREFARLVVSSTTTRTSAGFHLLKDGRRTCTFGAILRVDPGAVKKGNIRDGIFPACFFAC